MLKIYDTATKTLQPFEPIDKNHIKMYVCGPTVYDLIHIGNGRPIVVFDVLYRLLKSQYPTVTYVRNITDVDDKINARAKQNNETIDDLTAKTEQQFLQDSAALGSLEPDIQPRATQHIGEMIEMISVLIEKGNAYVEQGHALFSVNSWKDYGKFANKDYDDQVAGARVEIAPYKKDAADFVLWKPSNDSEPGWDSPWGRGRPGWHIECSAMAKTHLGDSFDIHAGGLDLIFPHHQNEIAQSCCANGENTFAKYWLHNGFLMSEGEKMSKSLGNFYTVRQLSEEFSGQAVRLVLLSTHYAKPLDFTKGKLTEAQTLLKRLRNSITDYAHLEDSTQKTPSKDVLSALNDNVNTPLALTHIWALRKSLETKPTSTVYGELLGSLDILGIDALADFENSVGLTDNLNITDTADIKGVKNDTALQQVTELADARLQAKKDKDFATADTLRGTITGLGYEVIDTADGYKIRKL